MLAIGPMSSEVIESVYDYSHSNNTPLMLIASKNQIDYNGGYVNNWNTRDYKESLNTFKLAYPGANVKICRDHCGPGFNGVYDLDDVYNTIQSDIENDFDLIHIDFCHFQGSKKDLIKETIYAIQYAQKINSSIQFEIGTDEIGKPVDLKMVQKEIEIFLEYCQPLYYVVNTGSLVKEDKQVGTFNASLVKKAHKLLGSYHIGLKEHNADYLSIEQIQLRNGLVNALNIAPQMGVVQTKKIIELAKYYKIDYHEFLNHSFNSEKWTKWIYDTHPSEKEKLAILAGHYNFSSDSYQLLYKELSQRTNIHQILLDTLKETIHEYVRIHSNKTMG
jgi:hypothetical protein